MKIQAKYEKGKVPAGLEAFYTVEKDGFMCAEFEDDVALATNPALAANNALILKEKKSALDKYEALVTSTGTISQELNELRAKVASGASITSAEVAILAALKGIDGTPDEIKKKIEEHPALSAKVASFESDTQNRAIASVMGWKPEVFGDLLKNPDKAKDLQFSVEDATVDGKPVKTAFVTVKNAAGITEKKDLKAFVEATPEWNAYLPVLKAEAEVSKGPTWIAQSRTTSGDDTNVSLLDKHIAERNSAATARANPLLPPPVTPAPAAPAT